MKIKLLLLISIFINWKSANGGSERKETLKKTLSVGQFCSEFSLDGYSVNEVKKEARLLGNSSWRHLRLKYAELYGPEELVKFMDLYDMKVAFKMLNDPKNVYKNYPNILYVLKLYHLTLQDEKKEEFLEKLNKKILF